MPRKLVSSLAAALAIAVVVAGTATSDANLAMASLRPGKAWSAIGDAGIASISSIITESEAQEAVWARPEVRQVAAQLRAHGVRPFTMIESTPSPQAQPGTPASAYTIYFGEDHGDHVVRIRTYIVDARTGQVSVYDPLLAK